MPDFREGNFKIKKEINKEISFLHSESTVFCTRQTRTLEAVFSCFTKHSQS